MAGFASMVTMVLVFFGVVSIGNQHNDNTGGIFLPIFLAFIAGFFVYIVVGVAGYKVRKALKEDKH